MTAIDAPITADVLDDEHARSDAWTRYQGQRRESTIPRGVYDSVFREVAVVHRKDGGYAVRMITHTVRLDRSLLAWRGLSEGDSDPFDLTEGQVKGWRKFADGMGIPTPQPVQQIIEQLRGMMDAGEVIQSKVSQSQAGQTVTLAREHPVSTAPVVRGEVVDESLEGKAADAFAAHTQVVEGKRAANAGFVQVAQGCAALLESQGWLSLGFESISEYLASPEVNLSRPQFYRLADIWSTYVVGGGVEPLLLGRADESKLEVPLPALKQGLVSSEQAVADAESMPRKDLRDHYRAITGDEPLEPRESRQRDDDSAARVAGLEQEIQTLREALLSSATPAPAEDIQDLRGLSRSLMVVLRRVLDEVGRPEQKRMGKELRGVVVDTLSHAGTFGLDSDAA